MRWSLSIRSHRFYGVDHRFAQPRRRWRWARGCSSKCLSQSPISMPPLSEQRPRPRGADGGFAPGCGGGWLQRPQRQRPDAAHADPCAHTQHPASNLASAKIPSANVKAACKTSPMPIPAAMSWRCTKATIPTPITSGTISTALWIEKFFITVCMWRVFWALSIAGAACRWVLFCGVLFVGSRGISRGFGQQRH